MGLVSIAMATYNGELFIHEQIRSILNQDYRDIEIVIVDDCSFDSTKKTLDMFEKIDSRIKVIHNDINLGCSKTFEKAILNCKGDYIALCDQDDVWENNKISFMLNEIGDSDLIYCDCDIINSDGAKKGYGFREINSLNGIDSRNKDFRIISIFNSFVLGCSILFKRNRLDKVIPIYHDNFNHDKWIISIMAQFDSVKFLDKKLFNYRIHEKNHSFFRIKKSFFSQALLPFYDRYKLEDIIIRTNSKDERILQLLDDVKCFESGSILNRFLFVFRYSDFLYLNCNTFTRLKFFLNLLLRYNMWYTSR